MTPFVVVDTNVMIVANGRGTHADDGCVRACVDALSQIRFQHRVLVDEIGLIFGEYRQQLAHSGQPGLGDAFFKWLWDNQANIERCQKVGITPIDDPPFFVEFPADPDLVGFDASDRKFVAVVAASGVESSVVNAVDTDWWLSRDALLRNGVAVDFLCPHHMQGAD